MDALRPRHHHAGALTAQGLVYASRWKVQRVFAADFDHSIFSVPLGERRRRLLAIDWIEDVSVSRVWPDRLVVRHTDSAALNALLVGEGLRVAEIGPQRRSLEQIVLDVTTTSSDRVA